MRVIPWYTRNVPRNAPAAVGDELLHHRSGPIGIGDGMALVQRLHSRETQEGRQHDEKQEANEMRETLSYVAIYTYIYIYVNGGIIACW